MEPTLLSISSSRWTGEQSSMYTSTALIAATILAFVSPVETSPVYKVEFTVRDAPGGPTQRYSMQVDQTRKARFQATNSATTVCASTQFLDTGATIEVNVHPDGDKVALAGTIEITSVTGSVILGGICEPIIGERKVVFDTTAELGKAAQLADDPKAPGTHQIAAVVTKVN